jgi:hypothetical protein
MFVADFSNSRVLMLDSTLNYVREVVFDLGWISRMWCDEHSDRLYVAVNKWENGEYVRGHVEVINFDK